ncbi:MAG TPA: aldose epimerase family protein [Bryobacteraceae bacterium]|jgi:aldose 1-epimerase|nr:aldose epimerase family protein [Bryobacteraceae bacterium]
MIRTLSCAVSLACVAAGICSAQKSAFVQPWGQFDGKAVFLYTLKNSSGAEVRITNYGGTIAFINVKDGSGKFGDVVLGFTQLSGYTAKNNTSYFGATIGRYANRIGHGTFKLDGKTFNIPQNENGNTLHGGTRGFDKRVWDATSVPSAGNPSLTLHRVSPDGEEGFPGNLDVTVRFSWSDSNELKVEYTATTDKNTVLNLANHSYFNLSGPGSGTILDDSIQIPADHYTPVTKDLIPTGEIAPVAGTPFDFQKMTKIGARINDNNQQLKFANGYDQNFVLNRSGDGLQLAARVEDSKSGRVLEVSTDQPGVQFYTGNFLNGTVTGIGGVYKFRSALCLETQHFPDSPNHPNFPSTELKPGEKFASTTVYKFSTK